MISPRLTAISATTGRIGLASLFILGGINKLLNTADTLQLMRDAALEPAELLLPLVVALELGGGILVAVGRWKAPHAAIGLAIFTLMTNLWFHDFWSAKDAVSNLQLSLFFKNVAIAGALVYVAGSSKPR